jgi:two-component system, LytTR family, sensor histidine kinase AlgZ
MTDSESAGEASRGRDWLRLLLLNSLGALVAFSIALQDATTSWQGRNRVFVISLVYANCIGVVASFLVPRLLKLSPAAAAQFVLRIMGLAVATAIGILIGATLLVAVGLIPTSQYRVFAIPTHWPPYALPTILAVGFGISLYEAMRSELEAATLRLRTKERDEARARQTAAEAQLSALEARVQPHFLFNTLNSIASLIPDDPAAAERMVGQLSALMRSSLESEGARAVPLADELRVVDAYLGIERARFGARLRCDVSIGEGVGNVAVPRLSVQTLVENAVKYAVSSRREGASVWVRTSTADGRARIEVADDGPGFAPEQTRSGHGLDLLRSRLALLFDGQASLTIDSRPGATSVVMEVPAP